MSEFLESEIRKWIDKWAEQEEQIRLLRLQIYHLLRERNEALALLMTAYDLVGESIGQRQYDYEARARSFVATCVAALAGGKDERL